MKVMAHVLGLIFGVLSVQAATNAVVLPAAQAEGTLAVARGIVWLEQQQAADGSLGARQTETPAITALALAALRAGGSTNVAVLAKATTYVRQVLDKGSNDWTRSYGLTICRSVLSPATRDLNKDPDWVLARRRMEREYSARARDFEMQQRAWQEERAAMLAKGVDADQVRAESVARGVMGGAAVATEAQPARVAGVRRGYGNLSYDGALRLLHEDVAGDDPRVDAYLDWAERGWTLEENPGKGKNGLFFFYQAMSKCLAAGGQDVITPMAGGAGIHWREELIRKLVAMQKRDATGRSGYWENEINSYFEGDRVLVTAYAILTLQHALGE